MVDGRLILEFFAAAGLQGLCLIARSGRGVKGVGCFMKSACPLCPFPARDLGSRPPLSHLVPVASFIAHQGTVHLERRISSWLQVTFPFAFTVPIHSQPSSSAHTLGGRKAYLQFGSTAACSLLPGTCAVLCLTNCRLFLPSDYPNQYLLYRKCRKLGTYNCSLDLLIFIE